MKKIPMRLCLVTNLPFPKKDLFRIVKTPEGEVKVDKIGKMNGRGAYISRSKDAIVVAKNKKLLDRKLEIKVPDEIYDELLGLIEE